MNFLTPECLKKATFCKLANAQTMQNRTRFFETFELKFIRPLKSVITLHQFQRLNFMGQGKLSEKSYSIVDCVPIAIRD